MVKVGVFKPSVKNSLSIKRTPGYRISAVFFFLSLKGSPASEQECANGWKAVVC